MISKDVVIIGAGAAGLMCAIECGKRGRSVLVLDHADQPASKVLISGGGRSNFTNLLVSADHYLSGNPHFCKSALARFTPRDVLSLVSKHHITYYEKEAGQMFCVKSSRDLVDLLDRERISSGAGILTKRKITDISKTDKYIVTMTEESVQADSLVIATGGLSYENLGASGLGHEIAKNFGLAVTELRPALAPFVFYTGDRKIFKPLSGISLDVSVSSCGKAFRGNILFTHRGLSGPAALQASLYWEKGNALEINLLPGKDIQEVFTQRRKSKMEIQNLLAEFLPKRFALTWCDAHFPSKPVNETSDKELRQIAQKLHGWRIIPQETEGYETAEVTAGGVDTDELSSKTLEAKKAPGLFFIGEVVDVTGELGGYNLHWAWASGFAAGQFA